MELKEPMTREEAVHIASRALALITGISAVSTLTYLPDALAPLVHYLTHGIDVPGQGYLTIYYFSIECSHMLRFFLLSGATLWFWNCGPGLRSMLTSGLADPLDNAKVMPTS